MEVIAVLAVEEGLDGDLAVQCALLHDAIEDTMTTFKDVAQEFGPLVARGVLALTKDAKLEESKQLPDTLSRIVREPKEIWVVKLADRIANLNTPRAHRKGVSTSAYHAESIEILNKLERRAAFLRRAWQPR